MSSALRRALMAGAAALRPAERVSVSDWMENNIRLPSEVGAIPGPIKLFAYQPAILDACQDPEIHEVTVMKSARIGYTVLLCGLIGHFSRNDPSAVIALQPVEDDCRDWVKSEILPIFQASPVLRDILERDKRNKLTSRFYPGGSLRIVAARAPRNLRRMTARVLLADEIDGYELAPEGDALLLATRRVSTFPNRLIVRGSSPTNEPSRIDTLYNESDKRVYEVQCPHCNSFSEITWSQIQWPKGEPHKAQRVCPDCGVYTDESHKAWMINNGRWRTTAPEVKGHAGFRINALSSTVPAAAWGILAREFLAAQGNPERLQVFFNTMLGEVWRGAGEQLDPDDIRKLVVPIGLEPVPAEILFITGGCDIQIDRIEVVLIGWTADGEPWVLHQEQVWGSPHDAATWAALDRVLTTPRLHAFGGHIPVDMTAVDCGDGNTMPAVLDYCQPRRRRGVIAVKGDDGPRQVIKETKSAKGYLMHIVGVDGVKSSLRHRITNGNIQFSDTLEERFFIELSSEKRVIKYTKGVARSVWVRRSHSRAESLDCVVYAVAAHSLVRGDPAIREAALREFPKDAAPRRGQQVVESKWVNRRR